MADNSLTPQQQNPMAATMPVDGFNAGQSNAAQAAIPINSMGNVQQMLVQNRRGLLFVAGSLMLAGFMSLMLWSSETPYRAVYSGMNEKDASAVVEFLQKEKIPYKLEGTGTVLVPADKVYDARLKLASQDMMPGTGTGFEIFDRANSFGVSDFTQKVNLQRAMQGELARTIEVIPQVTAARVHLVMPKESAFAERDRKASASVMLQMMGSQRISKQMVAAIQNLVAAGVPELDRTGVTIVDSSGNLLSVNDEEKASSEGQTMQEYQVSLERRLEGRLTSMLEQVVGNGQAVVRVTTKINREYIEQNSKRYNPDEQVVRSSKVISESRSSTEGAARGVPGMSSNTPGETAILADGSVASAQDAGGNGESANRRETTNNYEISLTSERKVIPFGSIDKISVAVIVGGSFKEGEGGEQVFVPRSKDEIKNLRALVERAAGFDEDRGDTVDLKSLPLVAISSTADMEALTSAEDKAFYLEIARYGVAALALILLALFVLKPLAQKLTAEEEKDDDNTGAKALPGISDDAYARLEQMDKARLAVIGDPERAGKIVRQWAESV